MIDLTLSINPLYYNSSAVYPNNPKIREHFTAVDRYEEEYEMFREDGDYIHIPRNFAPVHNDSRTEGNAHVFTSSVKPRTDEQARVIKECSDKLNNGESFLLQAATGFGKTVIAMDIIANVGKQTLVVVTKTDILEQWVEAAEQFLGLTKDEIGIFRGPKRPSPNCKLAIGMIQTLAKPCKFEPKDFEDYGLVIWDECHRVGADYFANTGYLFPGKRRLGLSATPTRRDGKDVVLVGHIGDIEVSTEVETMIPHVTMYNCDTPIKMYHDFGRTMQVNKVLEANEKRNNKIAWFVTQTYAKDRPTIVFADTISHLESIQKCLINHGIKADDTVLYTGKLTAKQREAAKVKPILLATYAFTAEATNLPWLSAAVLASPKADVIQIVGRIRREYPNKPIPLVFDVVDTGSKVFRAYAKKRLAWYQNLNASILDLQ